MAGEAKSKYCNTVIYKIICNDESIKDIYVGSTTNIIKRVYLHKSICNRTKGNGFRKVYDTINQNGGWSNWSVIEIEKYPCSNTKEARIREQYWYDMLNPVLNSALPAINMEAKERAKQYYQENKEKRLLQMKAYNEAHKDKNKAYIKEYMKNYRKNKKNIDVSNNWIYNVLTAMG